MIATFPGFAGRNNLEGYKQWTDKEWIVNRIKAIYQRLEIMAGLLHCCQIYSGKIPSSFESFISN